MDDDFKLTYKSLKLILKNCEIKYEFDYKFSKLCIVPFYLPNINLAIGVNDSLDRTPQEFQLSVREQHEAQWCERHHILYITYDGRNDKFIKNKINQLGSK